MGFYKYIRQIWKRPKENLGELWKERLIAWRRGPSTVRIERPTNLARARSLGWKPIQGIILVRQRVKRGGRKRETIRKGRRPKHFHQQKILKMNYQWVAEQRAARKYKNCEVLNSYKVAEDGQYYWYEVILVDRNHPRILKHKQYAGIAKQRGRVFRGLTSAARKSRGLRKKGKGTEKIRPSLRANKNLGK